MIDNGEAGISCEDCGFEVKITTGMEDHFLSSALAWTENGNPVCPSCSAETDFHSYLES